MYNPKGLKREREEDSASARTSRENGDKLTDKQLHLTYRITGFSKNILFPPVTLSPTSSSVPVYLSTISVDNENSAQARIPCCKTMRAHFPEHDFPMGAVMTVA